MDDKHHHVPVKEKPLTRAELGYNVIIAGSDNPDEAVIGYDKPGDQPDAKKIDNTDLYVGEPAIVRQIDKLWCEVQTKKFRGWLPSAWVARQPQSYKPGASWAKSEGPLYGESGRPAMDDVRQGNLGDCYFLAPLAAIANTSAGKDLIMTIIQAVHPGIFSASFCNIHEKDSSIYLDKEKDTETVDCWFPVTQALQANDECFLYCPAKRISDRHVPIWSAVLEKVYARWNVKGYADMDNQVCSQAIANLTGLEPLSLHWDPASKEYAEIEWNPKTFAFEIAEDSKKKEKMKLPNAIPGALLHQLQVYSKNPQCILVAGSLRKSHDDSKFLNEEYQIKDSHVYVIVSISEAGLVLWEPKAGLLAKAVPVELFVTVFNDVLTVDCSQSKFR